MQRVYLLFGGFSPSNTWQPDPVSDNSPFFTELEGGGGGYLIRLKEHCETDQISFDPEPSFTEQNGSYGYAKMFVFFSL